MSSSGAQSWLSLSLAFWSLALQLSSNLMSELGIQAHPQSSTMKLVLESSSTIVVERGLKARHSEAMKLDTLELEESSAMIVIEHGLGARHYELDHEARYSIGRAKLVLGSLATIGFECGLQARHSELGFEARYYGTRR